MERCAIDGLGLQTEIEGGRAKGKVTIESYGGEVAGPPAVGLATICDRGVSSALAIAITCDDSLHLFTPTEQPLHPIAWNC